MDRILVIGGGIAGVAAGAHLSPHRSVILVEREPVLAAHTTGRSAALFVVNYGGEGSRPLARASEPFLQQPPSGVTDAPLLTPRGSLWITDEPRLGRLKQIAEEGERSGAGSRLVDLDEALRLVPALRREVIAAGLYEPRAQDIDVAGLHQAFVRLIRRHGGEIRTSSPVTRLRRVSGGWEAMAGGETLRCSAVVNAAGAWGDEVARLAGVEPIGLTPMRRTAFMVPGHERYSKWPMVVDVNHDFYFRPDGVQLLCSLAEEKPSPPTDPRPEMEDVALAIERINRATTLDIRTVNSSWTGLRTFAPDRELVVGEDPTSAGFFWLVGQGGTGIMSSPAYGALIASQVLGEEPPQTLLDAGVDPAATSPSRLRTVVRS